MAKVAKPYTVEMEATATFALQVIALDEEDARSMAEERGFEINEVQELYDFKAGNVEEGHN